MCYEKQQALDNYNLHFARHLLTAQNELRMAMHKNNCPTISGSIKELFWIREVEWLKEHKEKSLKRIRNNDFDVSLEEYTPGSHGENRHFQAYYNIIKGEEKKNI